LWHVTKKYELADPKHARQPVELPDVDRDDLASLFFELGYETGVELGVETGKYSEVLLKRNPNLRLFCVDAWKAYQGYRDHVTQSKVDGLLATAKDRLAPFEGRVKFIRKFSVEASRDFRDTSLDFVYIDANHGLPWVMDDICAWEKKVRKGGIVAGHDYCRRGPGPYQCHVVQAVNAYTDAFFISPWFVVGRKDVKEGEKRDRPRSWFWVKE
jgi:hypothetical protein